MNFPEVTEALDSVGGGESQEVQVRDGLEVPFHIRYDHVSERAGIVAMKDLVCLLFPFNDLIDPFGSRRREGGDEGLDNSFVDFRCFFNEKAILLGILQITDGISGQHA